MTQGYGPYQTPQVPPPGYGGGYGTEAVAPAAKRASVTMYVIGALVVLGGMCCGGMGAMLPQLLAQQPDIVERMPAEVTAETMQLVLVASGVLGALYGVALVVLGLFVGKGKRGAIIGAIVVVGLGMAYMVVNALGSLRMGVGGVCLTAVPFSLHVLLLVWLVQGLKRPAGVAGVYPQQYPPGYLEYWQQYQRWQQQQGGGQVPPMPPPPPPGASGGEGGARGPTDAT